jgi:hypothetical protein
MKVVREQVTQERFRQLDGLREVEEDCSAARLCAERLDDRASPQDGFQCRIDITERPRPQYTVSGSTSWRAFVTVLII